MNNDRVATSNDPKAPKKLHKPHREVVERRPEEVITYASDDCYDTSFSDLGS